jgi:hypothetical protein
VLHQAPDQAKRQDRGAPAHEQPEMWAVCPGHAPGQQSAQSREGYYIRAVAKQERVEPSLSDDLIWVEAEVAQGRNDILGGAEADEAGREPPL